jgi:predicted DNA-binding transcriptional regulator AlpA
MGTSVPYESTGRTQQKSRTRQALVAAARQLLADGHTPTVESAAQLARISRTTAYRYFTNQPQLLAATFPEIDRDSLLGPDAPADVAARLDMVIGEQARILREWEPQLRTALRLSLEPAPAGQHRPQPVMRGGRAITWIRDALAPLAHTHPAVDLDRLAIAIRATCGIEAMVWLVDVAGLSRDDAAALMHSSAQALLAAAMS